MVLHARVVDFRVRSVLISLSAFKFVFLLPPSSPAHANPALYQPPPVPAPAHATPLPPACRLATPAPAPGRETRKPSTILPTYPIPRLPRGTRAHYTHPPSHAKFQPGRNPPTQTPINR
ncbi:hypothetical protein BDZ97DRAFT_1797407 [Flammula alnicola]|nr:hypothetical protein BDZ97DRAFT_1797407 [Flammula alnicola]